MINKIESPSAICFGEVLWDMLPDGPQPGGAPLNVAYHLNKLGLNTQMISRIGNDKKGDSLKQLIEKWFHHSDLIQIDSNYTTSEVIASLSDANEVKYEIIFPVAWDFIQQNAKLTQVINAATYFIYGSLSSRNNTSKDTLLALLDSTTTIKVLDVNFRWPFVSSAILEPLLLKADIAKLNEEELKQIQTLFQSTAIKEIDQVNFIRERFLINELVITKGASGASYYKDDKVYHGNAKPVKVKDTIGSGDAFLAAFINSHHRQLSAQEILKNAMDMGGFIATKKGACPSYEIEEYLNINLQ